MAATRQSRTPEVTALGLPASVTACLFDLDGVLTQTAAVHAQAWKALFDAFLRHRAEERGERFVAFDPVADYDRYVDGKPRLDGVRSFLAARHIEVPEGTPEDRPAAETVHGLGKRKDELFLRLIHEHGVARYEGSVRYVEAARAAGLKLAVVSSSKNTTEVLKAAGLDGLFDAQMDGNVAEHEHLPGKPRPDTYLRAAKMLGVPPRAAAVFEDALAGVEAGRAGGFGIVVGVDRHGQDRALREHGADVVVQDLSELLQR